MSPVIDRLLAVKRWVNWNTTIYSAAAWAIKYNRNTFALSRGATIGVENTLTASAYPSRIEIG